MSNEPPKRTESCEITIVSPSSPRSSLAPVSTSVGPTIEQLADIERARRDLEDVTETLVPCPGPCLTCPCCRGLHMVSGERAAEYRRQRAILEEESAPPASEPPPRAA